MNSNEIYWIFRTDARYIRNSNMRWNRKLPFFLSPFFFIFIKENNLKIILFVSIPDRIFLYKYFFCFSYFHSFSVHKIGFDSYLFRFFLGFFFFSVLFILCSNSFFFFYISFSLSVAVYSYLPINRSDTFLSLFLSFLFCCAVVLFYLPLGLYALKCSRTLSRFSSYEITKHLFPANVSKMCLLGLCLRHDNQ